MEKMLYRKWLERVNYDIETADAMLTTKRYVYAVFMSQQALEKCFKAYIAFKGIEIIPIHNLRRLAHVAEVLTEMTEYDREKIDYLSQYYLNARYKEDIEELVAQITLERAKDYLVFVKEKIQWLTQKMK